MKLLSLCLISLILLGACDTPPGTDHPANSDEPSHQELRTGADVLVADSSHLLDSKRVGLIVNHTAVVDTAHLADRIHELPNTEVTALFGPEHGIRGTADAGEIIEDDEDADIGAPIYSLYGETRQPTPTMLEDVDLLIFDIQDIGARFYTYISTMAVSMQAAAESGIPFMVLDRPNPLGGEYVSGYLLEPEQESFVGQFQIPIAHGMTVGELAEMVKGEALMTGLDELDLRTVTMEGWSREMMWEDTGKEWLPPSPNIPDVETAIVYPGTCYFEATNASEGRGTYQPFLQVGAPWADSEQIAEHLNELELPGAEFEATTFVPEPIEGMDSSPKLEGQDVHGVRIHVADRQRYEPVETGIHIFKAFFDASREQGETFLTRPDWLDRLSGSKRLREHLENGASAIEIIESWEADVGTFRTDREPYLLY